MCKKSFKSAIKIEERICLLSLQGKIFVRLIEDKNKHQFQTIQKIRDSQKLSEYMKREIEFVKRSTSFTLRMYVLTYMHIYYQPVSLRQTFHPYSYKIYLYAAMFSDTSAIETFHISEIASSCWMFVGLLDITCRCYVTRCDFRRRIGDSIWVSYAVWLERG